MDSYDLFKKLTTNLSFCKELGFNAKNNQTSSRSLQLALKEDLDIDKSVEKRKLESDDDISDKEVKEAEIQIVGNLTSSSIISETNKKKRKNKKQKLSNEKLEQIKIENINHLRNVQNINVNGTDIPAACDSFEKIINTYNVPKILANNLLTFNFDEPTPIQMQAIPVLLNSREILACAPTGSGKTLAYLFPLLYHLKNPENVGFRALILAPTRELVRQIYLECNRLSEGMGLKLHIINNATKALNKFSSKSCKKYDILITTPNRLIYLLNQESKLNLSSVQWLVIDEADKLFEDGFKGFREQLAIIYKACDNPLIKHAMFSATYTKEVEEWSKLQLDNLIQVTIGRKNVATFSVEQELIYVGNEHGKLFSLRELFKKGFNAPILIFVQSKDRAKELFKELIYDGLNVDVIHAERSQQQRDNTVRAFRQGKIWVLICTELMGRGIDFKGVNLVINYDFPLSSISYIHRIGRTGRAGKIGKAVTFFTDDDLPYLRSIANVMREAGCEVPTFMLNLNKPSKKLKRKIQKKAPKRSKISTALKSGSKSSKKGKLTEKQKDETKEIVKKKIVKNTKEIIKTKKIIKNRKRIKKDILKNK